MALGARVGLGSGTGNVSDETRDVEAAPPRWDLRISVLLAVLGGIASYLIVGGRGVSGIALALVEVSVGLVAVTPTVAVYFDIRKKLRRVRSALAQATRRLRPPWDGCREERERLERARKEMHDALKERAEQPWALLKEGAVAALGLPLMSVGISAFSGGILIGVVVAVEFLGALGVAGYFGVHLGNIDHGIREYLGELEEALRELEECERLKNKGRGPSAGATLGQPSAP